MLRSTLHILYGSFEKKKKNGLIGPDLQSQAKKHEAAFQKKIVMASSSGDPLTMH